MSFGSATIEVDQSISKARDRYVEAVTEGIIAYLTKQGIHLTVRAQEKISDIIRFDTIP